MFIELDRMYILSAPKACVGMTPNEDSFIEGTATGVVCVKINKVVDNKEVKSFARVYEYKNKPMQAIMFVTDYPENIVKKKINEVVERHKHAESGEKKG